MPEHGIEELSIDERRLGRSSVILNSQSCPATIIDQRGLEALLQTVLTSPLTYTTLGPMNLRDLALKVSQLTTNAHCKFVLKTVGSPHHHERRAPADLVVCLTDVHATLRLIKTDGITSKY